MADNESGSSTAIVAIIAIVLLAVVAYVAVQILATTTEESPTPIIDVNISS